MEQLQHMIRYFLLMAEQIEVLEYGEIQIKEVFTGDMTEQTLVQTLT